MSLPLEQEPVAPRCEKPSYSRPPSRPASAGSQRVDSRFTNATQQRPLSRPCSAGSVRQPQAPPAWRNRPASAGSVRSQPTGQPISWSRNGPSSAGSQQLRPSSAGSQRPPTAPASNWPKTRPASAGSTRHGQDTSSARQHSPMGRLSMDGPYDLARRAIEEELREPNLTPVPAAMATPLERQVANAIGLHGSATFPRLPRDVESCNSGGRCCWRWLARAAIEEVSGTSTTHLNLREAVPTLREEIKQLRADFTSAEMQRRRAENAEEKIGKLEEANALLMKEVKEFRSLERETGRLQTECHDLKSATGRMDAVMTAQSKEIVKLKSEMEYQIEQATTSLQARAEQAERALFQVQLHEEDLQRRLDEAQQYRGRRQSSDNSPTRTKPKLSKEAERRQRRARRAAMQKKAAKKVQAGKAK
eukprot:TRINITY_DN2986_c0_g1_i1.p1 TRINITY_DN2986_c0_g1~~TRINITY_DN2986_c0_g1_i1.p1  ORF type:complete len:419 (-),score=63.89 TRINITY_DN2986_c0_g1_i1:432-1688(-)